MFDDNNIDVSFDLLVSFISNIIIVHLVIFIFFIIISSFLIICSLLSCLDSRQLHHASSHQFLPVNKDYKISSIID